MPEVVGVTERVPLNLRVHPTVKEAYDDELVEKYGVKRPYAGVEVEREARREFCDGEIAELAEAVEGVLDETETTARKKELPPIPTSGNTAVVRYRVHEDVRAAIMQRAEEGTRTAGEIVGELMWDYTLRGGIDEKLRRKLEAARDELAEDGGEDESKSTAEKIAGRVGDQFTVDDFQEATTAEGVTTEKYAVQEYLRDVLEITETGPHPENPSLFVSKDKLPDHRDPSNLPYHAMTDAQKREAIKIDAIRQAVDSRSNLTRYTATDAVETLDGRPRATTVRPLMRDVAEESPENGFEYKPNEGVLIVDPEQAQFADYDNENALSVLGLIDEGDGAEERIEMDPPDPTPSTSSGATPARTDGGDPDGDKEALKAEADDRLAVLTGAVSDA